MKLLDTTVFGDILDGRENVRDRLLQHAPAELAISSIVRGELLIGATRMPHGHGARLAVEQMLAPIPVIDFDERLASAYGVLQATMWESGNAIGVADAMIAATAIIRDATLVTSDAEAFAHVPGLITEDWRTA